MYTKIFLLTIFFIANTLLSIEPVLLTEDKGEYPLGLNLEILEDKEGKKTLDDIQNNEFERNWMKSKNEVPSFGFSKSAYWVRFKTQMQSNKNFYLEIAYPHLDKIDFYSIENNKKIVHKKAGDFLPFSEREIRYRNFTFLISSPDNEDKTYYIRFESESSMQFPMKIWSPIGLMEKINNEMIGMGLYFGVMLVMALYNLFIWFSVRDESYFYYVLYIIIVSLFLSNIYGITYQYLWFGSPSLYNAYFPSLFFLANLTVLTFTSKFLQIRIHTPLLYKVYKVLVVICVVGFTSSFLITYRLTLISNLILSFFTVVCCLSIGIIMVIRKYRIARLYLLAWSALLVGGISLTMKTAGILPTNFFTEYAFQIGSALEVILLSLGLADRINDLKKKNEIAQAKAMANQILAIENLEQANKQKDEFLANTSHEFRTPLNGIIGIAESLTDGVTGNLPIKTKENLSLIISSGKRLSNLINDILDFSKLKHHELRIHLQAVDIYSITNLVLKTLEPLIINKKLELTNNIPKNTKAVVADENRLQQILNNLIGNAIKFTVEGKISINVKLVDNSISLNTQESNEGNRSTSKTSHSQSPDTEPFQFLQITIADTGIGIPADKLETIFKSFEQVDASSTREYGGTGLGLSVTKQLVELQGGKIFAESVLGKGSQFIFTLPTTKKMPQNISHEPITKNIAFVEDDSKNSSEVHNPLLRYEDKTNSSHILVVDDEPVNLQVISNHFSLRGYKVTTVGNGNDALKFLAENDKPDLILLDVMMPMMTGFEVCLKIREKYDLNQLPILFLTAKNSSTDLLVGLDAQGNDYIVKPFSKIELLSRVRTHIKLKDYSENLEKKVDERTFQLSERIIEVEALKTQQDADYFLTTLLIEPLLANKAKIDSIRISFFVEQKKKFFFRKEEYQLGGDICISGDLNFKGTKYAFIFNGDAMGKSMQGAGGALVIGSVINSIITYSSSNGEKTLINPDEWLHKTYDEIQKVLEAFDGTMLVSCVLGLMNESSGEMIYFNADHPFPILVRDRKAVYLEEKVNSSKIGLPRYKTFTLNKFQFQKDDIVFIGSDGKDDIKINGIINEDNQLILNIIEDSNSDMKKIYDSIANAGEITDDISLVKIEFLK